MLATKFRIGILPSNRFLGQSTSLFHTQRPLLNDNNNLKLDITPDELNRIRKDDETVYYETAGLNLIKRKLPLNFRKAVSPIYMGPYAKQISMAKKVSLGFGIIGVYVSKILYDIDFFLPEVSYLVLMVTTIPYPIIQYLTSSYVVSITRIYDKNKPQTLENLVKDESFIISKLNFTGQKNGGQLCETR